MKWTHDHSSRHTLLHFIVMKEFACSIEGRVGNKIMFNWIMYLQVDFTYIKLRFNALRKHVCH